MLEYFVLNRLMHDKHNSSDELNGFQINEYIPNKKQSGSFRREYIYQNQLFVSFNIEDVIQIDSFLEIIDCSDLVEIIVRLINNIETKILDINNELESDRKIDENLTLFIE
jgi:hypothetical protein